MTNSTFKSYMQYERITSKSSRQYKLIHSKEIEKSFDGLLRSKDGYICVALSSRYGKIGDKFIITYDNGNTTKVIKAEEKASKDVINECNHPDRSMIEVIIDKKRAKKHFKTAIKMGDFNYSDIFNGVIKSIDKVVN